MKRIFRNVTGVFAAFVITAAIGIGASAQGSQDTAKSKVKAEAPKAAPVVPAAEWTFDQAHSGVQFSIRHILTEVNGSFDDFSGTLHFDTANLAGSSISVEIPIASINTRNGRRDDHLKTADFFDAEKFPKMSFVSKEIISTGNGNYIAKGTLTIKDVSKQIAMPFKVMGVADHPMKQGHIVTGARAEFTIKRNDFGVGTGSYTATAVVGDEVKIVLDIEATRSKGDGASKPAAEKGKGEGSTPKR